MPGFNSLSIEMHDGVYGTGRFFFCYDNVTNRAVSYSIVKLYRIIDGGVQELAGNSVTFYVGSRFTVTKYFPIEQFSSYSSCGLPSCFLRLCYDVVLRYHTYHMQVKGEVCEEEAWVRVWSALRHIIRNHQGYTQGTVGHSTLVSASNQLSHCEIMFRSVYLYDIYESEYNLGDETGLPSPPLGPYGPSIV
jgi:hypothetical protein